MSMVSVHAGDWTRCASAKVPLLRRPVSDAQAAALDLVVKFGVQGRGRGGCNDSSRGHADAASSAIL